MLRYETLFNSLSPSSAEGVDYNNGRRNSALGNLTLVEMPLAALQERSESNATGTPSLLDERPRRSLYAPGALAPLSDVAWLYFTFKNDARDSRHCSIFRRSQVVAHFTSY